MVILGIDPGLGRTGWGVIKKEKNNISAVDYGCIETPAGLTPSERILDLFRRLNKILSITKPELAGVETLFFNTNLKTAISVGEAKGVILLSLSQKGIPIREFTPLQVKQAVTGYGRAEKSQIQKMVKTLLKLDGIPQPDDAADALAVAITAGSMLYLKS